MTEILLPENAPAQFSDRQVLWNEVQKIEKRSDAQLAREVEVAFPREMTRAQLIECVRSFVRDCFTSRGMIADVALHDKGDGNPHAHIMLTVRGFDESRNWQQKTKSVYANSRDSEGRAIFDPTLPVYDSKDREGTMQYRIPALGADGKQKTRIRKGKGTEYLWEKITIPANDWNDRANSEIWRASWAEHCNKYLEPEKQIDHRSYVRQGLDQEPTIHEGVTARKMESSGKTAERCEINREIRQQNALREQIKAIAAEIADTIMKKARALYERITKLTGTVIAYAGPGADDQPDGGIADRKRKTGEEASVMRGETPDLSGNIGSEVTGAGRSDVIKRDIELRKPEISAADLQLERFTQLIRDKEAKKNERIRKLMERRRTVDTVGEDAGPDRGSGSGEEDTEGRSGREEQTFGREGTSELIRDLAAAISAATGAEESARTERADRENERRRSDLAGQREAKAREREAAARKREDRKRNRSRGRSL